MEDQKPKSNKTIIIAIVAIVSILLISIICFCCCFMTINSESFREGYCEGLAEDNVEEDPFGVIDCSQY